MIRVKHIRRIVGWSCFTGSLLLLAVVVLTYARQPDHFAAFTLMPIWVWGGFGILACLAAIHLLRVRIAWLPVVVWLGVVFIFADEARTLRNFGNEVPQPGPARPHQGKPVIRIISANCDHHPVPEIAAWKPDVVLLQDVWPHQARRIARELYGKDAQVRIHETNAIVTHWKIIDEFSIPHQRAHLIAIEMSDGSTFKVANVHLLSAATDLSLWRRAVWTEHRVNRAVRSSELNRTRSVLESGPGFHDTPTILGGDFNAPPGDPVYRLLETQFTDAHSATGTRWGNTYHRRFPILRIDRLHASRHFIPVRCGTHVARASDHRFVVADFVLKDGASRLHAGSALPGN